MAKLSNVTMIINPNKFNELKDAMDELGIRGMTVTDVKGCGAQRGKKVFYRGTETDMTLLPKTKVEVVVSEIPVGGRRKSAEDGECRRREDFRLRRRKSVSRPHRRDGLRCTPVHRVKYNFVYKIIAKLKNISKYINTEKRRKTLWLIRILTYCF